MTVDRLLSPLVRAFLLARTADNYSHSTIDQYRWALERLADYLHDPPIEQVTTENIRAWLAWMRTEYKPTRPNKSAVPLSDASLFAAWKAVRAFYKWASPEFGVSNPSSRIPPPRHASPPIVPFSQDDIKALLKVTERTATAKTETRARFTMPRPTARRDRAIILLLLDCGLRVSELCRLSVADVDLAGGSVVVRPFGAGIKSRPRILPLGASCRKALAVYLLDRTDGLLFDMNRDAVLKLLVRLGKRAGVRDCHPHRFRHTCAIQFLRNGGDVFALQRLLGHASLDMVRHYLDLAQVDDERAHKKASPVDNWRL
jgi:integrase/recombinase XerD